jgi:hypothetical protein
LPVVLVLLFPVAYAATAATPPTDPAREAIVQALAKAGDIPDQARALVTLAWPAGKRDEVVAARARLELAHFGDHGMPALRNALNTVKIDYTAEVVATILDAQKTSRVEMAQEYRAAMLDVLWIGSHAAKVLAIDALAIDRTPLAVGPMVDSAIADPSLAADVVEALGTMRYQQARFYLDRVMIEGPPPLRPLAASSLAQIGGAALMPLKQALKAPGRDTRLLAVRALLPAATEYDLGAIYEYIEKHGDDDPELTQALKMSATSIEKAIAARDAKAAADSPKDF